MRFILGVLAGILSGLAFTASSIAQKRAINAIGDEAPLFRNLVKSPLWLAGFALAFVVGAPLNMASYMAIGPTLPPALNSVGLAAVPILARIFLGERPAARSYAGAATIALAVACIGFSGVAIDPEGVDWVDRSFLLRAAITGGGILAISAACVGFGLNARTSGAAPLALAAGAAQALANALMAPIAGQLGLLVSGGPGLVGLAIAGAASAALAAVNFGAIAVAQLALRRGSAALVIPIQQLPIQVVPLIFHAALYREDFGTAMEAALLASGLALLVVGSFALGRAGPPRRGVAPAAAACLALLFALAAPSRLDAEETGAATLVYRYACLDDAGRNTGIIEMRVTSGGGGMELASTDSAGIRGYARLGAGMIQEEVDVDTASGGTLRFKLAAQGEYWETEGRSGGSRIRAGKARLGDRSLFFILPSLIDPKKTGGEARFDLVRPEGGQRATMRLRAEGIVDAPAIGGRTEPAYRISMELADPIGRRFWPYKYNYYYRVEDLRFLAYDGPDENKRNSRIILLEVR